MSMGMPTMPVMEQPDIKITAETDGLSEEELAQKVSAFSKQVNQLMQEKARLYS